MMWCCLRLFQPYIGVLGVFSLGSNIAVSVVHKLVGISLGDGEFLCVL